MIDISTKKPLQVSHDGDAPPYIMVPVAQLDGVCQLLDTNGISYWVDEEAISLNDQPEVTVINLVRETNVARVQNILDSAA